MSLTTHELGSEGTPTYLRAGDPNRTFTDFANNTTLRRTTFRFG